MKMRHVSVFRVKPEYRTPEVIEKLAQMYRDLPKAVPTIIECEIGVKPFPMPTVSPDGNVQFYDLIQIITFANEDDCKGYPATQGHMDILHNTCEYMEQVIGLDYPV